MRSPFSQRAFDMGLEPLDYKLLYKYTDKYGEIIYRQVVTMPSANPISSKDYKSHETDGLPLPIIVLFTKSQSQLSYQYCGHVSNFYQFIGHDVLNQQIRDAIKSVGMPVLTENTIMSYDLTRMRNEIVIQSDHQNSNVEVGDVLPVMVVNNSYDGTKAATIAFGIAIQHNRERLVFSFNLGEMRQVHIVNSNTEMSSVVSSYMEVFNGNIFDLINDSFQSQLTDHHMLSTLDMIESISKKRRVKISKLLQEMNPTTEGEEPQLPSAWQMFLAIVRYSSFEPNLNAKRLLENAAESVLVIPVRMFEVLDKLQSS